ncbi:OLD family protein [Shimia marina]|uniref:Putative ATP-binding protein involved in virulence n=1 Tax=Shimia marina TaxID=321267 RepID=A0A0P1ESP6_9RHOB|nr:hypothetical protein [Shimia marina]CUH53424.1 putative ATP-binding protein involved in virulence [Shimia marina]SFD77316.1 hypothetical protein SAMN04488037_102393 [Shimia marina]
MPTYLEGLAIQFYRGIGPETQYIAPFSDMNFFVGENNAGKSVVLNLIAEHLNPDPKYSPSGKTDTHRGAKEGHFQINLGVSERTLRAELLRPLRETIRSSKQHKPPPLTEKQIEDITTNMTRQLLYKGGVWLESSNYSGGYCLLRRVYGKSFEKRLDVTQWEAFANIFGVVKYRDPSSAFRSFLENGVTSLSIKLPPRMIIPAKRQLSAGNEAFDDLSGKGLIQHLAEIQNPDFDEREKKTYLIRSTTSSAWSPANLTRCWKYQITANTCSCIWTTKSCRCPPLAPASTKSY